MATTKRVPVQPRAGRFNHRVGALTTALAVALLMTAAACTSAGSTEPDPLIDSGGGGETVPTDPVEEPPAEEPPAEE